MYHFEHNTTSFDIIQDLAECIWPIAYAKILSPAQMRYMLDLFYQIDALKHQHNVQNHQFILAFDENNSPCGFASFSLMPNTESRYRLHKLYVLQEQQGKGLGKALLQKIKEEVKNVQSFLLELNVNRHNDAVNFYKKCGFDIIREEDIDIGHGYFMNDYVMEKLM